MNDVRQPTDHSLKCSHGSAVSCKSAAVCDAGVGCLAASKAPQEPLMHQRPVSWANLHNSPCKRKARSHPAGLITKASHSHYAANATSTTHVMFASQGTPATMTCEDFLEFNMAWKECASGLSTPLQERQLTSFQILRISSIVAVSGLEGFCIRLSVPGSILF